MNEWRSGKIKDFGKVVTGTTPPTANKDYWGNGYKFVTPTDIDFFNYFVTETASEVTEKAKQKFEKRFIPPMSVSYTCIGNTIGKMCLNREVLITNQQINTIIPFKNHNTHFIYYYLNCLADSIRAVATGAATPIINKSKFENIKIKYAPLPTQQKIAYILSAYDDLIENNLKMIQLLEEMAQITYEQWFVRMKFPGYENTPIDAVTQLPKGWTARPISELCTKITDGTHETPREVEKGVPLVTGRHILGGFIDFDSTYLISEDDHTKIKQRSGLSVGDILFSNIGTLGNIGVVADDAEFSCKNVIIFKQKAGFDSFLYTFLANEHTKNKLDAQSAGVAQKFYSLKFIRALTEILPEDNLINEFDIKIAPIYRLKYQLHKQNQMLKEARDILLPRIMTGMINVDHIELPNSKQDSEAA